MNVWHSSSSESKPCVVCGKKTSHYKVHEQSGMDVTVPLCDNNDRSTCYSKVDVKKMAARFLTDLKKEIKYQQIIANQKEA